MSVWLLQLIEKLDGFRDPILQLQVVYIDHLVLKSEILLESHRLQELIVSLPKCLVHNLVALGVLANFMSARIDHRVVLQHVFEHINRVPSFRSELDQRRLEVSLDVLQNTVARLIVTRNVFFDRLVIQVF